MKQTQAGFTLIELIAVIVILGILAATAIPRFINLQDAADQAALNAFAGSIESASNLNYAADLAENAGLTPAGTGGPSDPVTTNGQSCQVATVALMDSTFDLGGYLITAVNVGTTDGAATTCTITNADASLSATYNIIATTDDA